MKIIDSILNHSHLILQYVKSSETFVVSCSSFGDQPLSCENWFYLQKFEDHIETTFVGLVLGCVVIILLYFNRRLQAKPRSIIRRQLLETQN